MCDRLNHGDASRRLLGRRSIVRSAAAAGAALLAGRLAVRGDEDGVHWTYSGEEGPEFWGELSPEFAACRTGEQPSPLSLIVTDGVDEPEMTIVQAPTAGGMLVNNGHTLQVNLPEGNTLILGDREYELLQFHMHTPAEHEVDGVLYPLEIHLVHRNDEGQLAVLGVLLKEGDENPALTQVLTDVPEAGAERSLAEPVDVAALLPADRNAFQYAGSLTTPPCSEGVTWTVFEQPMTVSAEQLAAFRALYPMNARPVQPLNDR
ncbi:MAG: carbonic anhydrase [Chloroflexota bacterium]